MPTGLAWIEGHLFRALRSAQSDSRGHRPVAARLLALRGKGVWLAY